jgi:hypothetical protein
MVTAAVAFVSGLPTAPFVAAANAIVPEVVDASAHARAFALTQASHTVMAAGGAVVTAWAIEEAGVATVFLPAALVLLMSAWLASVRPATSEGRAPVPSPAA